MRKNSFVIAMGGPNASGKSTLIKSMAEEYVLHGKNCLIIRSDAIRKNEYSLTQFQAEYGDQPEISYNEKIRDLYLQKLENNIGVCDVLLLDAAHTDDGHRTVIEQLCMNSKVDFLGLRFRISKETCLKRMHARKDEFEFASLGSLEAHFSNQTQTYSASWDFIDAEQDENGILFQAKAIIAKRFTNHII